jgi:predicted permease
MPAAYSFLGPDLRVDLHELAFTAAVSLLATLVFTLTPAFHAWKVALGTGLKSQEVSILPGTRRWTARNVLVPGQIALSVVVMMLSLLLLRSLDHVRNLPIGFDTHKKLAVINMFALRGASMQQVLPSLVEGAAGLPGVKRATYAFRILLSGSGGGMEQPVAIPGYELPEGQSSMPIHLNMVGPNYFETVGTRILQGRGFTSADGPQSQKVVIVTQFMARRFWPRGGALGKFIKIDKQDALIVGIAEDAKLFQILETPEPYMYVPFLQHPSGDGTLIVESDTAPDAMIPLLREEVHAFNPALIIWHVDTVKSLMDQSTFDMIVESRLTGALSLLGVFLAAMGLYGVVAYILRSRTREVGIRLALGAGPREVQALFLLRGLKLAVLGVLVGLLAALAAGRLASGLVYGVRWYDPLCLVASASAVTAVALLACYLPARRAAKVDPMVALRYE